ncbi:MAG: molybdate ABC transporter substrate-binding protein [Burkholderiales bacterium]|nr:molybdate ABC transporter substrate-binding protein [Ferrovum sp.]
MNIWRLLGVALFFCAVEAGAVDLVVSAAASLAAALNEIKPAFEATHPDTRLFYNFAASGILARQIEGGAPVDVFISASPQPMDQLQSHRQILDGTRIGLLSNELVLVVPKEAHGRPRGFADLSSADRIAIGDPGFVPAGQYAVQILRYLGLWESLRSRLIYGQDVRQVLEYVARAEVDAGIVFATDATLLPDKVTRVASAPVGSHQPVLYPAAVMIQTRHPEQARAFLDFLTRPQARALFEKHGFDWALK